MNPTALSRPAAAIDEAAVIAGCQRGSRGAQEQLYRAYRPHVVRMLYRLLGPHRDDVDDVVQEVFMAVLRSIPRFRGDSRLSTWVYGVAANVALQWLRRQRRAGAVGLGGGAEMPVIPDERTPLRASESRERMRAVQQILDEMSDKKRLVFILHELEQCAPREIAAITGVPVLTVRTRLHYARREFFERASKTPALAA